VRAQRAHWRELERRGVTLRGSGHHRAGPCPKCGGDDRFSISKAKQVFNCRGCGIGGDVIKLVVHLDDVDFVTACKTLTGEPPPRVKSRDRTGEPRKVVAAEFPYKDENGVLRFVVERLEFLDADGSPIVSKEGKRKKSFRQKRPDPNATSGWVWNVDGVPLLPYRLPELTAAIAAGSSILLVEGEGKVDLLGQWNIPATCCAGGAKKWRGEHAAFLRGANVVILPDNDDVGRAHMNIVAASLEVIAASIRILDLSDLPPKGDIVDWAANGGTAEQLLKLIDDAPHWRSPDSAADGAGTPIKVADKVGCGLDEDAVLERLEKLPPGIALAREIKFAAKQLGVTQDVIKAELETRHGEQACAPLHEHWLVEPWPDPVDSDALLRDIVQRIRRHVVCSHDHALAVALWVMFAWVHDAAATHSPILNINSAEPESGKSTTLGLISFLAPRCVSSVEVSEAALYRAIQLWQPSFVIDEFDSVLANEDKSSLRSVINSGHTRGQGVVRCAEPDFTPQLFQTFCPKAIGMIGRKLPAATLSRCIIVELRRRKSSESIEAFAHTDDAELMELRSRLQRWAADNADILRDAKPAMPEGFDNRRADNWRVMFAIADLAGEDWADEARLAARQIEGASNTTTISVRLLADIKRIFDEDGCDSILSAKLVTRLTDDEEEPWAEWGRGKGLTQNSLAVLLGGGGGRGSRQAGAASAFAPKMSVPRPASTARATSEANSRRLGRAICL
jgi:Protein of unknown function (DUF3631)/CHC2 zinc finger